MAEFNDLQRWMLEACVAPGGVEASRDAGLSQTVVGSAALPAEARLAIYARGYQLRLLECLRADFPTLRALVGDLVFGLFAQGYLAACPSRSYSLYDLGAGLAVYLEAVRPPGGDRLDRLPADLARLERARVEAERAPGVETRPLRPLTPDAVLLGLGSGLRLATPPSLRLVRASFALEPLIAAVDRGEPPPAPEARDVGYAVARSRYRVRIFELSPVWFAFLAACGPEGRDLPDAIAIAAEAAGEAPGTVWAGLAAWLPGAADAGMVCPV